MLKYVIITLMLVSHAAFAKSTTKEKCNPKFTNPIVDDRIRFTSCAIGGAMIGVLEEEYGDVLCIGKLVADETRTIYAFKGENSSKVVYFEEVESKFYRGAGEQESGIQIYKIKLKTRTAKLEKPKKERSTTLTHTRTWMYSDGNDVLKGALPGVRAKFESSVYYLGEDFERELKDFASEVCK